MSAEVVTMGVVNSRTFNQSPSRIKTMAQDGPVFVTDRGRPSLVVMSIDDYDRLSGRGSLLDAMRMGEDIDFEPVVLHDLPRAADL